MAEQEFDRFALDYGSVLEHHTRIGGEKTGYFARYKVQTVRDDVGSIESAHIRRILDFGCGVGQSIPYFRELFPASKLLGFDVSEDSIAIARASYATEAAFTCSREGQRLEIEDESIDLVFTACVLHHIPHAQHPEILKELWRVLKPGGKLFIFEHNPLNPLTVKIVNECPFDKNAVLIGSGVMRGRLITAGFAKTRISYCLFVPGWLRMVRFIESFLKWCPAGAQYYAVGTKGK